MIVFKQLPLRFLIKTGLRNFVFVVVISVITYYLSTVLHIENPTVLLPSMTVFGTVLSLFLAFRTNEAYNRWWEARILWGGMVNVSRSFAREIFAFLTPANTGMSEKDLKAVRRRFIYRHIGYINALRLNLRQQSELFDKEMSKWLEKDEKEELLKSKNLPAQLVFRQSTDLKSTYKPEQVNSFDYVQINGTLNQLYDIQGGCERIKNTVFPRLYSYYTTSFSWVFAFMLMFSLVDEFEWQTMIIRALVAYVFLVLNDLSKSLKNPFENKDPDTPMTALCRTIEIDLRQMLGETQLPKPIKPVNGILY